MMHDHQEMLESIGLEDVEDLFSDVPQTVRVDRIDLPDGMSEMEVIDEVRSALDGGTDPEDYISFLGAGIYNHFIPSAVPQIASRSEFLTSYTPYQAEVSQGMLQALFEYQSMIAELTGLEAVNSSNYDAASALGEAASMCHRINGKNKFLVPQALNWEKKSVLRNYMWGPEMELEEYSYRAEDGKADLDDLTSKVDGEVGGIYFEVPNFFGVIDPQVKEIKKRYQDVLLVVGVNPISLGVLAPPAEYGADIVVGEGQVLGAPMNCGGPLLGIFAARKEYVRSMPGRIIGLTRDDEGGRAFCMTLQTREQHIRRSKATSNICTNEALMAVTAALYLSVLGGSGLESLARYNMSRARSLMERIDAVEGYSVPFIDSPHFNEFVVKIPTPPEQWNRSLLRRNIMGGVRLKRHVPQMDRHVLVATTELHSEEDHDHFITALEGVT